MASTQLKAERAKVKEIAIKDHRSDIIAQSTKATSTLFKCGKCKKRKSTYYQLQTRCFYIFDDFYVNFCFLVFFFNAYFL